MANYEVLHNGVGQFIQGQVLTEKQAGPELSRLLRLGALAETDKAPTDPDLAGPHTPLTLSDVVTQLRPPAPEAKPANAKAKGQEHPPEGE